jgi:tetratricopeptide (TPR) repeat protein
MERLKILIFILLFSLSSTLKAQEDISKQLKEYATANVDRKVDLFFLFFNKVREIEKDSVLYYVRDLQKEGVKNMREDAIAMANYGLAPYLQDNSLFEEATQKLNKAALYYKKVRNDTMLAETYNALGNTSYLEGKIDNAELFYQESKKYAERSGEERFLMISLPNLAKLDIRKEKYKEGHAKIQRYIKFLKESGASSIRRLAAAHGLMGQLYLDQAMYAEAIEEYTRSMEYGLTVGSMKTVANGYTNLAIVEFFSENYDRSEQYFRLALAYRIKDNDKFYIAEGYYNLGDFYSGTGKMDSAIVNYQKSLEQGKEFNNLHAQKDALVQISGVYESQNKQGKQIEILKQIIDLQSKINKQQNGSELAALKMSYEQTFSETINIGGMREEELQSKIGDYQSIFNNWIVFAVICILGLIVFVFYMKKRSKS